MLVSHSADGSAVLCREQTAKNLSGHFEYYYINIAWMLLYEEYQVMNEASQLVK